MKTLATQRDILLFEGSNGVLVTAADSCGGIGEKPADSLFCGFETVGLFTARVTLLEVLATGAKPLFASLSVCNEPETAEQLLHGARIALDGVSSPIPWVVSTEKNIPTAMTALGVTVTGECAPQDLRLGRAQKGDLVCCAGKPLVGSETLQPGAEMFPIPAIEVLLAHPGVGSILPVGSRGIAAEAGVLAAECGLTPVLDPRCGIDLSRTAGPASCVLFTLRPGDAAGLPAHTVVGRLG